jgi:hypothetical protein
MYGSNGNSISSQNARNPFSPGLIAASGRFGAIVATITRLPRFRPTWVGIGDPERPAPRRGAVSAKSFL